MIPVKGNIIIIVTEITKLIDNDTSWEHIEAVEYRRMKQNRDNNIWPKINEIT